MATQGTVQTWKSRLEDSLRGKNSFTAFLEKVEKKTGIQRLYIVLAFSVIIGLYLMIGYGAQFLCNLIGFLYPAYKSVKAIETEDKKDDTQWLTYWVVYSVFSLMEFFADTLLFWIPLCWFLKCIFLIWCMAPFPWNGSDMIYKRVIRPFVLKHEKKIDEVIDQAADQISEVIGMAKDQFQSVRKQATKAATDAATEAAVDAMTNSTTTPSDKKED